MIPTPYWTIEALASDKPGAWNMHSDCILALVADGLLQVELRQHGGEAREVVMAAEKERFERETKGASREPIQHPAQRRADRMLLALMWMTWHGANAEFNDDEGDHHYTMRDQLAADVEAVLGMKMPRSRESDALAFKEGFEQLRAAGWSPRRKKSQPKPDEETSTASVEPPQEEAA